MDSAHPKHTKGNFNPHWNACITLCYTYKIKLLCATLYQLMSRCISLRIILSERVLRTTWVPIFRHGINERTHIYIYICIASLLSPPMYMYIWSSFASRPFVVLASLACFILSDLIPHIDTIYSCRRGGRLLCTMYYCVLLCTALYYEVLRRMCTHRITRIRTGILVSDFMATPGYQHFETPSYICIHIYTN